MYHARFQYKSDERACTMVLSADLCHLNQTRPKWLMSKLRSLS
jgi:hypothetical protein